MKAAKEGATIREVIAFLNEAFPLSLQESYDNSGLQVSTTPDAPVTGVLLAVDVTEAVVQEAVERGCNLVVTHHPLLFKPLRHISTSSYVERSVILAIKNDVSLVAVHTNMDNAKGGVNHYFAERLGLQQVETLEPLSGQLYKLTIYCPKEHAESIRHSLLDAGIGRQGLYDGCSFSVEGTGRFRALHGATPFSGKIGKWHREKEEAISIMCHAHDLHRAQALIREQHPYEEPVVDVLRLRQVDPAYGSGIIGTLPEKIPFEELIGRLQTLLATVRQVAHSKVLREEVQRIAFCGGSGAFLRTTAARKGADVFVTGEAKYNDYHDAADDVTLVTLGHYESEEFTKSILLEAMSQKFTNFATLTASRCTNPINYIR